VLALALAGGAVERFLLSFASQIIAYHGFINTFAWRERRRGAPFEAAEDVIAGRPARGGGVDVGVGVGEGASHALKIVWRSWQTLADAEAKASRGNDWRGRNNKGSGAWKARTRRLMTAMTAKAAMAAMAAMTAMLDGWTAVLRMKRDFFPFKNRC